jgi:hypothetical protein
MLISSVRRRLVGAVVAVVLVSIASTDAMAGSWANASGTNEAFGWSGGFNNTGRFGDPVVYPAFPGDLRRGFGFENTVDFIATNPDGLTGATANDFARVTVNTAASVPAGAPMVYSFTVIEWGTWSSTISDPSDFSVQADFKVFRFQPTPNGDTFPLTMPVTYYPDGTWTARRTLTGTWYHQANPAQPRTGEWRQFQVTVTNSLNVTGDAPAGSFIEKSGMTIIIPEPTTVLFLLAGFGPLVLRRSRP